MSNAESGDGFSDILIEPEDPDTGIVIEVKYASSVAGLEKACEEALKQIREKRYDERLRNNGRTDVLTYGIAEQEIFPSYRIGAVALPLQIGYNMNSVATVYRYGVRRGFLSLSVVFLKIKVF